MKADLNFLDMYMEFVGINECPPCYHRWGALFLLSMSLGRRCFIDQSLFKIYPNLFTVIIGDPGKQKKSTAINMVNDVAVQLQPMPNIISQKITPQALIEALKTVQPAISGMIPVTTSAEGYIFCDELKTFIDRQVYEAGLGPMLTTLYDCRDQGFSYHTKGGGKVVLKNVLLGMLGGSSQQFMREALPEAAIGSGVTRRMIFIFTPDIMPRVPFPKMKMEMVNSVLGHLRSVQAMSGVFEFTPEAIKVYEYGYIDWGNSELFNDPLTAGYANCRWDHVFKLSMCISAATRFDRIIDVEHIEYAIKLLVEQEENLNVLMRTLTSSEVGKSIEWVSGLIVDGGIADLHSLIRATSNKLTLNDLNTILDTLEQGRIIKRVWVAGESSLGPGPNAKRKKPGSD